MNELAELQAWYLSQCNGDWEHSFGIEISTLDNPGWRVKIALNETELEMKSFQSLNKNVGADSIDNNPDWFTCWVADKKFEAACGPLHLEAVLRIFLDWSKAG